MAPNPQVTQKHVLALNFLLENLGFIINHPKCILEATQLIDFLGFMVNSTDMQLTTFVKGESEENQVIDTETSSVTGNRSKEIITAAWQAECSDKGNPLRPSVLQKPTDSTE